jgi:hypothetical protein
MTAGISQDNEIMGKVIDDGNNNVTQVIPLKDKWKELAK